MDMPPGLSPAAGPAGPRGRGCGRRSGGQPGDTENAGCQLFLQYVNRLKKNAAPARKPGQLGEKGYGVPEDITWLAVSRMPSGNPTIG